MPVNLIDKGGTRGTVFREVARLRREEAKTLLDNRRNSGAIYLAGYAIECHLKFAYCQRRSETYLPARLEVHDWDRLAAEAGLLPGIKQQSGIYAIYSALVEKWEPSLRYRTTKYSQTEANQLYNKMGELYAFLREQAP